MCLTIKFSVFSPLVSAFASAFLSRLERNSADLTGQRALLTPNCLPVPHHPYQHVFFPLYSSNASSHVTASSLAMGIRTLGSTASAPSIAPHGHGFGVVLDVLEVGQGAAELPAIDGLGRLAGVLEGDTEVGAASARALGRVDVGGCVADLCRREWGGQSLSHCGRGLLCRSECIDVLWQHPGALLGGIHTILSDVVRWSCRRCCSQTAASKFSRSRVEFGGRGPKSWLHRLGPCSREALQPREILEKFV